MNKLITLCFVLFLSACSNYLTEEEELNSNASTESGNVVPMTLQVRSSPQETVNYPVHVFIFDRSGKEVKHSEIYSSQQHLDITLPIGEYELSSFAGLDSKHYRIPDKRSLTSLIETETGKPCPTPLQYGNISFKLQKKTNLSIHLSYIVSSLEFKFQGIPEDARSVEVGISPTSYAFSLGGSYSNDNYMCRANCHREGNEWKAGPFYTLPSTKSRTTLTLFIDRPSGEESLAYTYSSTLEAAQPYCFSGKYNEGISLGGIFEVDGWKPGINVDFIFSEEGQETIPDNPEGEDIPDTPSSSIIYCDELPQAGDFYKDFYIWKSDIISSTEANAIVLSKTQWFNILAADGPELLKEYNGLDQTNWRVFTKEEAKDFNLEFANGLPALNAQLRQHDQDEFYFYNGERYLCENCLCAFNPKGNSSVRAVGKKQTYYMRALKEITFKTR